MLATIARPASFFPSLRYLSRRRRRLLLPVGTTRPLQVARMHHSTITDTPPIHPDQELFSYNSGRYLYNETQRLAERHIEFNIPALKRVAAAALNRPSNSITSIRKLAEGGSSRVLLLTMAADDGFEVVVKIPFSTAAANKGLAVESEVATLDFLRSRGVPVPRVYAWCSVRDERRNEVGTEYIVMEKAAGRPLSERWWDLTDGEKVRLVNSYVGVEREMFSIPFGACGSVYYRDACSVPESLRAELYAAGVEDEGGDAARFCIGPTADYMFWTGKRAELDVNRGPWRNPHDYLYSTAWKERLWTSKFGKPKTNRFPHNAVLEGEVMMPEIYVDLLDKYLSTSPYLLPGDQAHPMNRPTMRHPDLNPTNIYITPTGEISSILDWQHTTILPLLLSSGPPPLFQNPDPSPSPIAYTTATKPTLPETYASLSPDEKSQADELLRRETLFYLYKIITAKENKPHFVALRTTPLLDALQHLVDRAGMPWTGDVVSLTGALMRVVGSWDGLMSTRPEREKVACPVRFEAGDEEKFLEQEDRWAKCSIMVEHWRGLLGGVGDDGWVRNESFEDALKMNRQLKKQWVDEAEGDEDDIRSVEQGWPFQDHEEDD